MKILIFLVMIFCLKANAEIVVRHPDTDETSYQKAIDAGLTSIVDHLASRLPSSADEKRLLQKFERAQSLFLASDLNAAKVAFIEITEECFRADWTDTQRKIITIAFLRSAQLSNDPHAIENYLIRAAQFNAGDEVDETKFPPPLVKQFTELVVQEKSRSVQVDLKEKFPQHDLIIVDGRRVKPELARAYPVMRGRHRVTALSNSHQSFTHELTASQLNLIKADVPPFAIGSCEEPAMSGYQSLASEEVRVIFPNDCSRTYTGTSWINANDRLPAKFKELPSHGFAASSSPKPVLTKKKLMIIGLGVGVIVTSALLIKKSQQRREEIQPVSRQGF